MLQPLKIIDSYKEQYEDETDEITITPAQYYTAIFLLTINLVLFLWAFILIFKYGFCMKDPSQTSNVLTLFALCILNIIFPYPYTCIGSIMIIVIVYIQKGGRVCYSEWRAK